MTNEDGEEMTILHDGSLTYACVREQVRDLLRVGFRVTSDGTEVRITPPVGFDTAEWLSLHARDVATMLQEAR